jgi:hypothetical protein
LDEQVQTLDPNINPPVPGDHEFAPDTQRCSGLITVRSPPEMSVDRIADPGDEVCRDAVSPFHPGRFGG